MGNYIKSYSNYVLKSKHQLVNDGTIWERDITTIGGVSDFPSGQVPIYKSGNFIITVNGKRSATNKYSPNKWKSNNSGDTWTVQNISELTSDDITQNDTKIVLKQDYYDLRDFAYYGSLTELMRASIGDILTRFPGELAQTSDFLFFSDPDKEGKTVQLRVDFGSGYPASGRPSYNTDETIKTFKIKGDETSVTQYPYVLSNPYGIDIHSQGIAPNGDPMRYFAEGGYENYDLYCSGATPFAISGYEFEPRSGVCIQPGEFLGVVKISGYSGSSKVERKVAVVVGDGNRIFYLTDTPLYTKCHIRPKQELLDAFYNDCDQFQRMLVNPNSSPMYKATFSVIKENKYGYYKEFQDFIFPTSEGGYNLDASSFGFSEYTARLAEIGEWYDERFTDNLYRAMTHESIKNFDWTRPREGDDGVDEDVLLGADRMKKLLRITAREFDEVKSYIDGIRNVNSVTYDQRNNIPDYFLTDVLSDDGWSVKQVYPYFLEEKYIDGSGTVVSRGYTEDTQLAGVYRNKAFSRKFYQDTKNTYKPYSLEHAEQAEYFLVCDNNCKKWVRYSPTKDEHSGKTYYDTCAKKLRFKICPYTSDKDYTVYDIGNQFLRNLKINSREILRRKGTIDGIEMLMAIFGMKKGDDYDISEYSCVTQRIEETWDAVHDMYHIDWLNSTKAIQYDYRSESGINVVRPDYYVAYQGLPVSYRYAYGDSYIADYTDSNGNPVRERYLYPHFSKTEKLDGDPYFQMDGGWISSSIKSETKNINFRFDPFDNIVYNNKVLQGSYNDETGVLTDDEPLYHETVNTTKCVDTVQELVDLPSDELLNGQVVYVNIIPDNLISIEGVIYDVQKDISGKSFVQLETQNGEVVVGSKIFSENVIVYDENYQEKAYYIGDKTDGYTIKAYIKDDGTFVCKDAPDGLYGIEDYFLITTTEKSSNYFQLGDTRYSDLVTDKSGFGWARLDTDSYEYKKVISFQNKFDGNNPHKGAMTYDRGHEYLTYFKRIFKYAYDNDKFDERCFSDYFSEIDEIPSYGFSGLIEENEDIKQYDRFLVEDPKIHYFGDYKIAYGGGGRTGYQGNIEKIFLHTGDQTKIENYQAMVTGTTPPESDYIPVEGYTFYNGAKMIDGFNGYSNKATATFGSVDYNDDVTDQIVNTKRMKMVFYLHYPWYTKNGQCEVKYIDDIVMGYVEQMIPSTTIVDVMYMTANC